MNKEYKFTLTKDYVTSWGFKEALREILQNAYDNDNKEDIFINDDSITIRNDNTQLHINTLLMGVGTKSNDSSKVGGFSEGSILSMLVLTREGYNVIVTNGNENWHPSFKYDEDLQQEILVVDVIPREENCGYFEYYIGGFNPLLIQEIKDSFLGLSGAYKSKRTEYGEILLDDCYKGKMFVNKLPIMHDKNFEYGYNFNSNVVKLDRDRKSINIYDLNTICSKSLMTLGKKDMSFVDKVIQNSNANDADYLKKDYVTLDSDFVNNYCEFLTKKYELKDNSVVINKGQQEVIEEIKKRKNKGENIDLVITERKIQADVINRVNTFSANKINQVFNDIENKDEIEDAYYELEDSGFEMLLQWMSKNHQSLENNMKKELIDIIPELRTKGFCVIEEEVYKSYGIQDLFE